MPTSASNIIVKNGTKNTVVSADDININGTSVITTLSSKQDVLTPGTGIDITNNVISSTLNSAQWGNITGTISNQTDLQTALDNKQNVATAVNYDNITNCITYIPQDIKLELNNGTLTLKAGSRVYVPNGTNTFDEVVISEDISLSNKTSTRKIQSLILMRINKSSLEIWNVNDSYSGTTQPTATYQCWYNTTNNTIKSSVNGGSTYGVNLSLPLCIVSVDSTGMTSIDQVFNGFGYIGSTVFALPGIQYLYSNGRNENGTLKNITNTTSSVLTFTWNPGLWGNNFPVVLDLYGVEFLGNENTFIGGERPENPSAYTRWYNKEENQWYIYVTYWDKAYLCIYSYVDLSNGKVVGFRTKTAFHAVDYNDFSDLKDDVEANTNTLEYKQDEATAVNYDNITNCITEIPQNIQLELNNGTLTLKAGSKVYVPNGAGVFTLVTTTSDVSRSEFGTTTGNNLYLEGVYGGGTISAISWSLQSNTSSGTTSPASGIFYNTSTNYINRYVEGEAKDQRSFPLALITLDNGTPTSIDQVFNGFGYIGSTVFVLPGVKGLIPNGRNADGTLKSIELSFSKVVTQTNNVTYSGDIAITSDYFDLAQGNMYNEKDNRNYLSDGVTPFNRCIAGKFVKGTNGVITSLTPKTVFRALDYNDSSTISGWSMPSSRYIDLTLGASGANYTAPANGWIFFAKASDSSGQFNAITNSTGGGLRSDCTASSSGQWATVNCPVKRGDIFSIEYTTSGETKRFRFIYTEGESSN